jgi:uncharacterized protein YegL
MTRENFTSLNVIIDASGSMASLCTDTIGSFNTFLSEQKAFPGEAAFTVVTFNDYVNVSHDFVKIASVSDLSTLSYSPGGNTALLDAMGTTIDKVGQRLSNMNEEDRPSKVLFLIITDGFENASRKYTKDQIKSMVEHQRQTYSWEFVFMGANIDAITAGTSLGIAAANSVAYAATKGGTHSLYSSVSSNTTAYRSSGSSVSQDFFGQTGITPTSPVAPATPTTPGTGSGTGTDTK